MSFAIGFVVGFVTTIALLFAREGVFAVLRHARHDRERARLHLEQLEQAILECVADADVLGAGEGVL